MVKLEGAAETIDIPSDPVSGTGLSVADQGPGIDPRLLSDPDHRAAAVES